MASYAMAHLKMDFVMRETGFHTNTNQRFRIYLTNSLEEHHPDTGTIWANWLSDEANEANRVKRDTPVMVVMGNPPYSVSSSNKGKWIENLVADYKKDLNERNIQPLSDDYIKFIRYGQHYIEKNKIGILAYISNNSFIDGIIHRQMRKNLLECFDKIYILDLHGNAKKKETAPDGGKDENVFDIQQGVSINIFVKTGAKKKNELGNVFHYDLYGKRELKYDFLNQNSIHSLEWDELENIEPNYFFVKKDFSKKKDYEKGIRVDELFYVYTSGIKTHNDGNLISPNRFKNNDNIYYYRPFDVQHIDYNLDKVVRHRYTVMQHMLKPNIAILFPRQAITELFGFFVSKGLTDINYTGTAGQFGAGLVFPLYLYPDPDEQQTLAGPLGRQPNLNMKIVDKIAKKINLTFLPDENLNCDLPAELGECFSPLDLLDYIYAVLHSPTYREKYKEFLKIDFPRVPYPKNSETFWDLVELGGKLREIHLMESPVLNQFITLYNRSGSNVVGRPVYKNGNVYINETQCFENVPEVAWNFYIGGYQPAQKWLKDRRNRQLSFEDILHYQRIIVALTETDRLMQEIDKINFE